MRIKLADLYDNTSPSRVIQLPPKNRSLQDRYEAAILRIQEALSSYPQSGIIRGDISIAVLEL